ncbi:unnamed protein product [Didymodactylos carnosus]|uniref:Uncharacterized protein n=1 Tax=Didymodactylos carnosus TaxID=1234261 RepID=A0A8S2HX11_9BILA|nr:unnamed protein product [Didymodactylos carnosus]CAF3669430.1 unnamed protein product [Didymodactylos carnosus]
MVSDEIDPAFSRLGVCADNGKIEEATLLINAFDQIIRDTRTIAQTAVDITKAKLAILGCTTACTYTFSKIANRSVAIESDKSIAYPSGNFEAYKASKLLLHGILGDGATKWQNNIRSCRLATRDGKDALRDLFGFYFSLDRTLAIYEYRVLGKRPNALPLICRGQYCHLSGYNQGQPYTLFDLYQRPKRVGSDPIVSGRVRVNVKNIGSGRVGFGLNGAGLTITELRTNINPDTLNDCVFLTSVKKQMKN